MWPKMYKGASRNYNGQSTGKGCLEDQYVTGTDQIRGEK